MDKNYNMLLLWIKLIAIRVIKLIVCFYYKYIATLAKKYSILLLGSKVDNSRNQTHIQR